MTAPETPALECSQDHIPPKKKLRIPGSLSLSLSSTGGESERRGVRQSDPFGSNHPEHHISHECFPTYLRSCCTYTFFLLNFEPYPLNLSSLYCIYKKTSITTPPGSTCQSCLSDLSTYTSNLSAPICHLSSVSCHLSCHGH